MAFDLIAWAAGWALTNAARKGLETAFPRTLRKELDEEIRRWAESVSEQAYVHPSTLFPVVDTKADQEAERPALIALRDRLCELTIPVEGEWLAVLLEQWRAIKQALGEGAQPFFLLSEGDAEVHLRLLARRIHQKCCQDPDLQGPHMINALARIEEAVARSTSPEQVVQQNAMVVIIQQPAVGGHDANADIDEAFSYTKEGQPDLTIAALNKLRQRNWDALSSRERYRLEANLGTAHAAKGDFTEAGRAYLRAKEHQPEDENARALEALGQMYLEEREQAHALATALCADKPQCTRAHVVRIRTSPSETSYEDLREGLPAVVRKDAEVQMALHERAQAGGLLDDAIAHARSAVKTSPEWVEAALGLGALLLQREIARVESRMRPGLVPASVDRAALEEAVGIFSAAVQAVGERDPGGLVAMAVFNRGTAHALLGDARARLRDLREAFRLRPHEVNGFALAIALDEAGQADESIEILDSLLAREGSTACRVMLASFLRDRAREGDLPRAADVLLEGLDGVADANEVVRGDYLELLVVSLVDVGRADAIEPGLERLPGGTVGSVLGHVLRARTHLRATAREAATAEVQAALNAASEQPPSDDVRRRLAMILQAVDRLAEAFAIWEEITPRDRVTPDTYQLIRCARETGRDPFLMNFYAGLRENGAWDRDTVGAEVNLLIRYDENELAVQVLQGYLSRYPEDKEFRVWLSQLGICLRRPELVESDPSRLPAAETVNAEVGRGVAMVLLHGTKPEAAVPYAYHLVRRFPDSPAAHMAMIATRFPMLGIQVEVPGFDTVQPGAAVQLSEEGEEETRWLIIEDENAPPPDPTRAEHAPDSAVAAVLLGKRAGEQVDLPGSFRSRSARVVAVASKYDARAQLSARDWEHCFPDTPFLARFRVRPPAARPTDLREVLGPEITEVLERNDAIRRGVREVYEQHVVPLSVLAKLAHESVVATQGLVLDTPGLVLRCCQGTPEELEGAGAIFDQAPAVVIESTVVATLFYLRQGELLRRVPFRVIVPEGVLEELRQELDRLDRGRGERMTIGIVDGEPRVHRYSAEAVDADRAAVQTLLDVLSAGEVVGGAALAEVGPDLKRWTDECMPGTAQALAIATSRGLPLWTDDVAVADISGQFGAGGRLWTQSVLFRLHSSGRVESVVLAEVSARLLSWGYWFTGISHHAVVWSLRQTNWDLDRPPTREVLAHFGSPLSEDVLLRFLAETLRALWHAAPADQAASSATYRILSHVAEQAEGRGVLLRFFRSLDAVFGLDVVTAERVRTAVEGWVASRRVVPGGLLYLPRRRI